MAALLVGSVVVLLGLASGLGIETPVAPAASPQPTVSLVPQPTPTSVPPTHTLTPPVAYVAVPAPAPPVLVVAGRTSPTPGSAGSSRPATPPTSSTPMPDPLPSPTLSGPSPACPTGLLNEVIDILDRTLGMSLIGGLLSTLLAATGLDDLTEIARLTPTDRAAGVRALVLGPLRTQAEASGSPTGVAGACVAGLTTRLSVAGLR